MNRERAGDNMLEKKHKYNHAFSIAFSLDTDLTADQWTERMDTREGISELCAHLIRRIQQVIKDAEVDAFDLWDSYEH